MTMMRTFPNHETRDVRELTGLWRFTPLDGDERTPRREVVPSCWQTYPGFENYRGRAEYSTRFTHKGGSLLLTFKGASHYAKVALDGTVLGDHYNAYAAFRFPIHDLPAGEHELTVLVDNRFDEAYSLNFPNDYLSYGGINKPVYVEQVGDTYVDRVHVTPRRESDGWHAIVNIRYENLTEPTDGMMLEVAVNNQTRSIPVDPTPGLHEQTFDIHDPDAREWSPDHPSLTYVTARVLQNGCPVDDLTDRFGYRTITLDGSQILLNGNPLRIKGFCRHEDHPTFGNALPLQIMHKDLDLIRDMGANSVRTSHYPNDERFLDLCDELGILVWEENHARGMEEDRMRNPNFPRQALQVTREMVDQHYNHPGIYIWGIFNECASETEYGRDCYQQAYAAIRELDSSRPVTSASCKHDSDICLDLPDVVSWNIYPYWYLDKTATRMIDEQAAYTRAHGGAGKPIIISEIGGGAIYGFHDSDRDVWTEEYQSDILHRQLTETLRHPAVTGVYIWQYADIRVDREWWFGRPKRRNNKGVVDEYRRPKLAYQTVKEVFTTL